MAADVPDFAADLVMGIAQRIENTEAVAAWRVVGDQDRRTMALAHTPVGDWAKAEPKVFGKRLKVSLDYIWDPTILWDREADWKAGLGLRAGVGDGFVAIGGGLVDGQIDENHLAWGFSGGAAWGGGEAETTLSLGLAPTRAGVADRSVMLTQKWQF